MSRFFNQFLAGVDQFLRERGEGEGEGEGERERKERYGGARGWGESRIAEPPSAHSRRAFIQSHADGIAALACYQGMGQTLPHATIWGKPYRETKLTTHMG